MTKDEAITVIKAYRDNLTNSASNQLDGDVEAFDMAIKALEQFETVTEFADRCRECGARYGKLLKQEPCEGITPATPEYQKVYMQGWNDGRCDIIEKIKREFKI